MAVGKMDFVIFVASRCKHYLDLLIQEGVTFWRFFEIMKYVIPKAQDYNLELNKCLIKQITAK